MTDEPRDLMAELMASLGIPDEPLDLAVAQPDAPMGETWWRDTARELRDEIERLRTELAQASEECQRHQVGESYQVGHERGSAVAVKYKAERDAYKARIDDAHALLRRWSGGLVPVGDYMLRAETDAALTGEAS